MKELTKVLSDIVTMRLWLSINQNALANLIDGKLQKLMGISYIDRNSLWLLPTMKTSLPETWGQMSGPIQQ